MKPIYIDDTVHAALKLHCAMRRETLIAHATKLVCRELKMPVPKPPETSCRGVYVRGGK